MTLSHRAEAIGSDCNAAASNRPANVLESSVGITVPANTLFDNEAGFFRSEFCSQERALLAPPEIEQRDPNQD